MQLMIVKVFLPPGLVLAQAWRQPAFEKPDHGGEVGIRPEGDQEMQVVGHEDDTPQ
jgi:hypothetical protein